jgi:hypothetical protein
MDEMDLEIDNYSMMDLEKFFKLKSKYNYTEADVEEKEYEIREQLLSSGHLNKKFKRGLIVFLTEAKNRIIQWKFPIKKENLPTTIQKTAVLDKSNVPKSEELPTSRMPNIIERPPTNYMNVQLSEYYQGTMNPLSTRTITKNITVDTRFRDRYYATSSSDFMITLPMRMNKVVSLQMTAIELPKNFYSISAEYKNNYFTMKIKYVKNEFLYEESRIIVVPDGNYTSEGLIKQLNKVISPSGYINEEDIFTCIMFSLTVDGENMHGYNNGKTIIQPNDCDPELVYKIKEIILHFDTDVAGNNDVIHLSQKLGWILGFINIAYYGSNTYISEKQIEPNTLRYLYLAVDDFNKSVNESFITAFSKNEIKPNILARISNVGKSCEDIIINKDYSIVTEPRKYFGPVDIQRLHVQLFDDYGRIINMNYCDYSFCLHFEIMYDL